MFKMLYFIGIQIHYFHSLTFMSPSFVLYEAGTLLTRYMIKQSVYCLSCACTGVRFVRRRVVLAARADHSTTTSASSVAVPCSWFKYHINHRVVIVVFVCVLGLLWFFCLVCLLVAWMLSRVFFFSFFFVVFFFVFGNLARFQEASSCQASRRSW